MAAKQGGKQAQKTPRLQPSARANWEEVTPEQMEKDITASKASSKNNKKLVKEVGASKVLKKIAKKTTKKKSVVKKVAKSTTKKTKQRKKNKDPTYNPKPDSSGASPIEHNLGNGLTMLIDAQSSFKPEYCQKLIEHMRMGDSFYTFGFTIGVGRRTLYHWLDKFPIFKDAYDLAWCGCLKFYEDLFKYDTLGMEPTMTGPDGKKIKLNKLKSDNLKYTLSRRFKEVYAEKQEIEAKTTSYDGNVDISQLTGEALDKRQKDLESQLNGTAKLIATLASPNPLKESDT